MPQTDRSRPAGGRTAHEPAQQSAATIPRCTHCKPVTVRLNRRERRRLGMTVGEFHADGCPYNQATNAPGYQAAGRVRSPFRSAGGQSE
jgi:hypothetical protein